jgi:SAM-dependent methyltransferase
MNDPDRAAAQSVTRGSGLLEPVLARLRTRQANCLISPTLRRGRILDIGCGSYPYFLAHTMFKEKFAVDRLPPGVQSTGIHWHVLDLNSEPFLPFEDGFLSVITLLAVVEHLNPASLIILFQEAYRTLHPGGLVILTTPAAWSDGLLRVMARINLVSAEEIREHVFAYTLPLLGWYFGKAGFAMEKARFGYFELMLNMWATAER